MGEGEGSKNGARQVGELIYREVEPDFRWRMVVFPREWHYIERQVGAERSVGVWGSGLEQREEGGAESAHRRVDRGCCAN